MGLLFSLFTNNTFQNSLGLSLLLLRKIPIIDFHTTIDSLCFGWLRNKLFQKVHFVPGSYLFPLVVVLRPHHTRKLRETFVDGEPILFSLVEVGKMLFPIINWLQLQRLRFLCNHTFSLFTLPPAAPRRGWGTG